MAKILIVDDSPTETYKLTGILERNGFQCSPQTLVSRALISREMSSQTLF